LFPRHPSPFKGAGQWVETNLDPKRKGAYAETYLGHKGHAQRLKLCIFLIKNML